MMVDGAIIGRNGKYQLQSRLLLGTPLVCILIRNTSVVIIEMEVSLLKYYTTIISTVLFHRLFQLLFFIHI